LHGGHELAVDVGDTHAVGVNDGEPTNAAAHQALGAPTAHAAHAENHHSRVGYGVHGGIAHQKLGATKNSLFNSHKIYSVTIGKSTAKLVKKEEKIDFDRY
jgi:hypothetical protein